jgi:AsmA protein
MSLLSLSLKITGALIVTSVITIGTIIATVDPNDYREEIAELVKKETGRDLQIQSLSLSFFPHFGLNLENTTLSNAKGFSEKNFLHIDNVQLGAALLPLLSQQLEVDTLTVHGLTLHLEKNAKGITNWADLISSDASSKDSTEAITSKQTNPLDTLASLKFGGLDIQQSTIHWHDQQANQDVQLTIHDFSTGAITFGEFFNVALSAEGSLSSPNIKTTLVLNIEAKLEQSGDYAIRNLTLKTTTTGAGIPVKKVTQTLSIPTLNLALENNQLNLPSLTVDYDVIGGEDFVLQSIKGQLQVDTLKGDLSSQSFEAQSILLQSHLSGNTLPNGEINTTLSMQPSVNLTTQIANLNKLSFTAMGIEATGAVKATDITSSAQINTQLNIAQTNLRALFKQLDIALPEMSDSQTLTQFMANLNVDFNVKKQAINVKTLNVTLDDSQLSGQVSISQFDHPNIQYNLALNKIDLNRYLPPKKAKPQSPLPPVSTEEVEIKLPVELLRTLTLNGTLKVGDVIFDKLHPKNILVTVKGSQGKITASPIKMAIFNTQIHAQAEVDVRSDTQKFSFKVNSQNISIGDALIAVADIDKLGGTGSIALNITTAGDKIAHFKQNLNGTVSTNLTNGFIKGFNLAQSIREAQAKMAGKPLPPSNEKLQTDFSSFIAQASIKQGIITTQKLTAQAPFMRILGSGKIDLPKESLNYLVRTKIVATDKGQGGKELQNLNGLTLPIKLKGNYISPKVSLDISGLLAEKTKIELENKKEAIVKETTQKVEKQVKEQLDGLLKGFKF